MGDAEGDECCRIIRMLRDSVRMETSMMQTAKGHSDEYFVRPLPNVKISWLMVLKLVRCVLGFKVV
jgi:hypothetical protein